MTVVTQSAEYELSGPNTTKLLEFLFEKNAYFKAIVSRFLRDNLPGFSVRDEHGLKGMMRYKPNFNPQLRESPTSRPDYVVSQQGAIFSILDAKNRDLWEKQLLRELLYQMVFYAISHRRLPQSIILDPTTDTKAKEARLDVANPIFGKFLGQVCLCPAHLPMIVELVAKRTSQGRRNREQYAKQLAFGEKS
jgi:5-methylcytosine-specific restriction enzyme subunit McrC